MADLVLVTELYLIYSTALHSGKIESSWVDINLRSPFASPSPFPISVYHTFVDLKGVRRLRFQHSKLRTKKSHNHITIEDVRFEPSRSCHEFDRRLVGRADTPE
jgi:hypothetical protein